MNHNLLQILHAAERTLILSLSVAAFFFYEGCTAWLQEKKHFNQKNQQRNGSAVIHGLKTRGRKRQMKKYFQQGFQKKWTGNEDGKQEGFKAN